MCFVKSRCLSARLPLPKDNSATGVDIKRDHVDDSNEDCLLTRPSRSMSAAANLELGTFVALGCRERA